MKKAAPNKGERLERASEPLVATESRSSKRGSRPKKALLSPYDVTAAYDDANELLRNAWKPELQSALENDVDNAHEVKGKIEASILKLPQKEPPDPDAGSRKRLDNDVVALCRAAAFERFAAYRSQSPAGKRKTESEINKLATLSARLVKHLESMHLTSRELVGNTIPIDQSIDQLQQLKRVAESVAVVSKDAITRLADVPFCEQSKGKKANRLAESVTRTAAVIFARRTGKPPSRISDRTGGKTVTPFIEWLAELFLFLKIKANANKETRKYLERAKRASMD